MAQYEITSAPAPIDFECDRDFIARTLQNAKNLLMCRMGEVPFDRMRGLDRSLFDQPMSEVLDLLIEELDRVMLWEPDVEVVSAWLEEDSGGGYIVHCVVEIEEDGEETDG